MAYARLFACEHCEKKMEAWDEGNPYLLDANGDKQFEHHPSPRRLLCIGVYKPHLCLACGSEFEVDSRAPIKECPRCGAGDIFDTSKLDGCRCPFCKAGAFQQDADFFIVS